MLTVEEGGGGNVGLRNDIEFYVLACDPGGAFCTRHSLKMRNTNTTIPLLLYETLWYPDSIGHVNALITLI